ncbi:MAG: HAD family hydrolase [Turicibacter sp.]
MELFVSDLDGTLLNKKSEISSVTREVLNGLIQKGVKFTVATARTHATVIDLLEGVEIEMPIAIMNGVGIYDLKHRKYLEIVDIEKKVTEQVLNVFSNFELDPLIYGIKDDELYVYYTQIANVATEEFYKVRSDKPLKTFKKVSSFEDAISGSEIVNMLVFDKFDKIKAAAEIIQDIEGITVTYYSTRQEGFGYMELYSANASKANGIKALSKYANYDKIVVFGDNLNDLPMFELADECYATANAVESIKKIATGVIAHHNEDAVAKYIQTRHQNK